jgi:hypothetical protein
MLPKWIIKSSALIELNLGDPSTAAQGDISFFKELFVRFYANLLLEIHSTPALKACKASAQYDTAGRKKHALA